MALKKSELDQLATNIEQLAGFLASKAPKGGAKAQELYDLETDLRHAAETARSIAKETK